MKVITITKYKCEVCGEVYDSLKQANKCESKPVTKNKGVKEGDIVLITQGEGKGSKAKVTEVYVIDMLWGHYAWERYWHTVAVVADDMVIGGTRLLTFDSYETLKEKNDKKPRT